MPACFLPIDKADKYWRDPWQKNLRNKLENRISVSEPFNDNQRGFNAGDLEKKIAKYINNKSTAMSKYLYFGNIH